MFCKACSKQVSVGDELRDEKGCVHSHNYQICSKCRPKEKMSEKEVRLLIREKIEEKQRENKNPTQV